MLFFKFILFSFWGYILECLYTSIVNKKINLKRGFFYGPYCPIYGFTLLIIEKFNYLENHYLLIVSILLISIIEYFTSYILEKIFKNKWWDYSRKKININGRICLDNIIIFSIGTMFIIRKIIPVINECFVTNKLTIILIFLLFITICIDIFISIKKHLLQKYVNNTN